MKNFIEDYLQDPSQAIASAAASASKAWHDSIDDEMIYRQIATPEFRLYEEIIFCLDADDLHAADSMRTVA